MTKNKKTMSKQTSYNKMNKDKIPVVILCGGRGSRLNEETVFKPKPLVEIGGRPILWHIMKIYAHFGFRHFILCLGYKSEMIKHYFLNYQLEHSDFNIALGDGNIEIHGTYHNERKWKITLAETGDEALTGTRIKRIEKYINTDLFMLTYGDGVAKINLEDLLAHHLKYNKIATVTAVRPPARFGELIIKDGMAVDFREKSQTACGYINGGFFVLNREIFKILDDRENLSFEYDVLEKLVQKKELAAFYHEGYWRCMDTLRDVEILNKEWQGGKAPWKIWN